LFLIDTWIDNNTIRLQRLEWQEAQLPFTEQGLSFMLSSHHNATLTNLAF